MAVGGDIILGSQIISGSILARCSQYIVTNRIYVIFYFFRGYHHQTEIPADHNIKCPDLF